MRPEAKNANPEAAAEMLDALLAIVSDCNEVLAGREPMTMELIWSIVNGKARHAIDAAFLKN